jgi:hypothetical protein
MVSRYGPLTHIFILNLRKLTQWSADDSPTQGETMEDLRDIEIQHGGGAIIIERVSSGWQSTISLQPGTKDSSFCSGLYISGELLEAEMTTVGTGEAIIMSGGVMTKLGPVDRGFKPSYDTYTMKFSKVVPKLGA